MRLFPWALLVFAAGSTLSTRLGAADYVVTADFPYASKYVFRGLPLAGASIQPSIRLNAGENYAGIWLNQPFGTRTDPELDFNAGHNFTLSGGWTLDAGMTAYYYPRAGSRARSPRQTFEGYLGLNGSIDGTNVGAGLFRDFTLHTTTVQGTVGYSLPLNANATLSLSAAAGGVTPDHAAGYIFGSLGLAAPCKLSDFATFTVGANWSTHDLDGPAKNSLWFIAGLTVTF